ncbi:DUF4238 domain-containing protein [Paracnuella aquatica]|uniref:DUF4238 domain-containing protein n=1 Tax=Paracnuella aquatica TaxID=2268757 RepID=UPI000DEFA1DC|nr:DUF4238 domain-containing protein [Paracnuella aquatica]RPD43402.1 DUF4238 domain-containing protein [Paracnuella aquatica]
MQKTNKPNHQHFIPRSYLRNFAQQKKDKRFVDAVEIASKKKLYLSTKDICVKSGLYTLPQTGSNDPYTLEKYYATHVDEEYPKVYELLLDKSRTHISSKQKHKILHTLLSLYFRTPKFLHAHNDLIDRIIDRAVELTDEAKQEINIDFEGKPLVFLRDEVDAIKKKLREENRQIFISTHLDYWHRFVAYKYKCAISVFEVEGDIDLITSDNPVNIHSAVQNRFQLFDPTNIIQIPLDRRHFLFVFPNTEEAETNRINRGIRDKYFALTSNLQTQRSAEKWIIGYPGTVEKHFEDQQRYGEFNEENLKALKNMEQKAKLMVGLLAVAQANGFFSQAVANKVKEFRKLECFEGDHELNNLVLELAKHGFLTV